jgi:hypothetical protein
MTDTELEQALFEAAEFVKKEGGIPDKVWHPDYGWIIWEKELTKAGEQFFKDYPLVSS